MNKRRKLIAFALLTVAGALWFGYGYYVRHPTAYMRQPTVIERPGLRLTASLCEEAHSALPPPTPSQETPKWNPPEEGVKSIVWRDDGTLQVVALMVENCGARVIDGGYSVRSGTIYLAYQTKVDGLPAACNCAYRLTYDISGVPKSNYEVNFPKTGMSVP